MIAVFRAIGLASGFDYNELTLGRTKQGDIKIVDARFSLLMEPVSDGCCRMWILFTSRAQAEGLLEQLAGPQQFFVKHRAECLRYFRACKSQDFAEVIAAFDRLPPELQQEKWVLAPYLAATCQRGDPTLYLRAVERFRACYPTDPAVDLILFNYYGMRGDVEQMDTCLERLDRTIGGDPFLIALRATLRWPADADDEETARAKLAEMRQLAESAIRLFPKMPEGYLLLAWVAWFGGDDDEPVEVLRTTIDATRLSPERARKVFPFQDWTKTPEFQDLWHKASHGPR